MGPSQQHLGEHICWRVSWLILLSKYLRSGKKTESLELVKRLPSLFRDWRQLRTRSEHVEPTCVYKLAGTYESPWLFIHLSINPLLSCTLDVRVLSYSWASECLDFFNIFFKYIFTGRKRSFFKKALNAILLWLMYVLLLLVPLRFYHC